MRHSLDSGSGRQADAGGLAAMSARHPSPLRRRSKIPRILVPLRHSSFALLWAGQAVSRTGGSVFQLAMAWTVYGLTHSSAAMGLVLTVQSAATVLVLAPGGAAGDKLPRQKVLLWTNAGALILVSGATAAAAMGRIEIWELVVVSGGLGLSGAFQAPSFRPLLRQLVEEDDIQAANGLQDGAGNAASLVGPSLGGNVGALAHTAVRSRGVAESSL